jgi:RNA polymerase sigma-70 factor, ECF subfamily
LCRYAMRLTGDASRADDVVRETLLRAWQPKSRSHNAVRALRLTLQETGVTR